MADLRTDVVDHHVNWLEVHRDAKTLVKKLIGLDDWKGIIAVTRGGLVPAAIIAREMDIRHIDTLCIATYDEQYIGDVNVIKKPAEAVEEMDGSASEGGQRRRRGTRHSRAGGQRRGVG